MVNATSHNLLMATPNNLRSATGSLCRRTNQLNSKEGELCEWGELQAAYAKLELTRTMQRLLDSAHEIHLGGMPTAARKVMPSSTITAKIPNTLGPIQLSWLANANWRVPARCVPFSKSIGMP